MQLLFPEGERALARVADDPGHRFFKRYGEAVPAAKWNAVGTKQGIYMIGPDAEYLGGQGAVGGGGPSVRDQLRAALKRWRALRKEKRYAGKPVPAGAAATPPEVEGKALVFRVHLRDLPRGGRDRSGRRFRDADRSRGWLAFTDWAWNENWIGFDDPEVFLPSGAKERAVDAAVVGRLCREVLVDNVRGQAPRWRGAEVKEAKLTVRRVASKAGRWTLEYRGQARMKAGTRSFAPVLFGRAVWNPEKSRFESFELVALGVRTGAGPFNQRRRDPGPAPMGVALTLHPK